MSAPEAVDLKTIEVAQDATHKLPEVPVNLNTEAVVLDGGIWAWLSIVGGWMVMFCIFGYSNSFGVFQDYYALHGSSTSSSISWIGSLQIFFAFFLGLPSGKLLDMGYFRITTLIGCILFSFSFFMLSLTDPHQYYQLVLSQGIGMGLGSGLLLVPAQSVQAHHWKKRRAMAMGIVATGSGFGGIIYPIMLNQLINGSLGFAWGVRATAFLTLGLLAVACCIMTSQLPRASERQSKPMPSIKAIVTDAPYIWLAAGYFLVLWSFYYPYFYLQLWINLHGMSRTLAFYSLAIMNASSIPGRLMLTIIAADLGFFNMLCFVIFAMGVLVFAMFGVLNTGAVIVFAILYGFFSGGFLSLTVPAVAGLAKSVDEVGIRLGLSYCIASIALLTGTPINGALLGPIVAPTWYKPTLFSAITIIFGSILTFVSRSIYSARRGASRV